MSLKAWQAYAYAWPKVDQSLEQAWNAWNMLEKSLNLLCFKISIDQTTVKPEAQRYHFQLRIFQKCLWWVEQCWKFDVRSFEGKNRVFEFDFQWMNTFEFVRCSKNDVRVRSMFDKMVFDPSLENGVFELACQTTNKLESAWCSYNQFSSMFNKWLKGSVLFGSMFKVCSFKAKNRMF